MFDLHVHTAPDIWARRADDATTVGWYDDAGFAGCVLKAHYDTTVARAASARRGRRLEVYGGVALNQHVGGLNPAAVTAALLMGARVVWMPTADAHTQQVAGLPRLCGERPELPGTTYAVPPVDWSTRDAVLAIVRAVAEADAVLATGHLSTPEVVWLLDVARRHGVRRLLLTHPTYTVPAMTGAEIAELTGRGAYAEITAYQLLAQPGCDAARLAALVRQVGYDRVVLSSDTGQPDTLPPPEALHHLVDALAGEGLDRSALLAAASDVPRGLVTP